ncbi:MAG: PAS domain-containing sensor histidine kinase [Peptostreptococcaceae bacterium]
MGFNIYKDMIEESPIAYLHIKILEDELGNYTSIKTIHYNRAYEVNILTDYRVAIEDIKKWTDFLNKVKVNKKHTVEKKLGNDNNYYKIDGYYGGNNEFHFRLDKINTKKMKLSPALKNAPFSIWMKDKDGKFLDVNQKYLDFLGTTREEIIGKTNYHFTTKENADKIRELEDDMIKNNKFLMYEDKPKVRKGHFEVFKWPYVDQDETTVLGVFGMAIDITEKVKLNEKLRETEQQFLDIANNINDIILIRDDKKALYINSAFEKIYKFSPEDLYEDINKWYDNWDEVEFESEPKPYSYDKQDTCTIRVKKKGQEDIWVWNRFVPVFNDKGELVKKIGIISDITDMKKMQLEIDEVKMDFFANISHELRTPINLILSALQLICLKMDNLDNENKEFLDKYLNIIGQNGRRLLRLVNNLIDTTRLNAGCFSYNAKNADIVSCIEDICTTIVSFVNSNNLKLIFDTNVEEKIIAFDPDNMERIILNLVSNAIKFNKPNGKIEVTVECSNDIKITIKDTGVGIPPEKLETIFERFEQVQNKLKNEREGSGIGLYLVKSLVDLHGGNIVVKSKLGEGSEFIMTLPDVVLESNENIEVFDKHFSDKNRAKIEFSDL